MATTNDLKNGIVLNLDGQLWTVTEFQHVKPGKGGAFVRTTLKNVLSGKVVDRTFNAGTKVETTNVDKRGMTYLYQDGADYVFMDGDTFDQIHVPGETVGSGRDYLLENTEATVAVHDGVPLYVELPVTMELVVEHTDPGLQGDRSTGGTKPATLETGAQIQVPLFITTGEKLKVATRDGRYLGRANRACPWLPGRRHPRAPSTSCPRPTCAWATASPSCATASRRPTRRCPSTPCGWSRGSPSTRPASTSSSTPTHRTGRSTGCPTSTGRSSAWRRSSCCGPTTCPISW